MYWLPAKLKQFPECKVFNDLSTCQALMDSRTRTGKNRVFTSLTRKGNSRVSGHISTYRMLERKDVESNVWHITTEIGYLSQVVIS